MERPPLSLVDWCSRGPEFRLSIGETRGVLYCLAAEVQTLHSCWVVQRSINLESIAYDGRRACLCDFRFARKFSRGKFVIYKQLHKLFRYCAPEVWYQIPVEGPSIDIWALGVCAFRLATGEFPFPGFAQQEVFEMIGHHTRPHFPSPFPSHRLKRLLRSMLQPDHSTRISAAEVLMHPFFIERIPSPHPFRLSSTYSHRSHPPSAPQHPTTGETEETEITETEITTTTTDTTETETATNFSSPSRRTTAKTRGFVTSGTTSTAEDLTDTDPNYPPLHWQRASISRPLNELVWSPALPPLFFDSADRQENESSLSFQSTILHELSNLTSSTDSSFS